MKKPKTGDHQSLATALGDQLARMVDNPLCADVQLLVGQEATPVYASKVILMARSPVFEALSEALLGSNFREGQPPPWSSTSSSWSGTWSSSLAPVFWHRAEIRTMRHLLHCLYTDQLPPDFATSSSAQASSPTQTTHSTMPTERERDLVELYVAADRYLVDVVRALAERELMRRFEAGADQANVLPVFNLALVVAPTLAMSACQPFIKALARRFLGDADAAMQHHLFEAFKESNFNKDLQELQEKEAECRDCRGGEEGGATAPMHQDEADELRRALWSGGAQRPSHRSPPVRGLQAAGAHPQQRNRQEVTAKDIMVTVYNDRRRIQRCGYKAKTCISVPGKLAIPFNIDRPSST